MMHTLTPVLADVRYDAVAVRQPRRLRDLRNFLEDISNDRAVFMVHLVDRADVLLRDNKNMNRSLRIDIAERKNALILVYLLRRDLSVGYLQKRHMIFLLFAVCRSEIYTAYTNKLLTNG